MSESNEIVAETIVDHFLNSPFLDENWLRKSIVSALNKVEVESFDKGAKEMEYTFLDFCKRNNVKVN